MRVLCCQLNIAWEDKQTNYAKVRSLVEAAQIVPGSMLVLPEMFSTGFSMNVPGIQEHASAETERFLASLARDHQLLVIGGQVTAGPDLRGRNEAVVFSPKGKLLCRYAKIHPFSLGGESEHYMAGNEVVTFAWQGFTAVPFICYDLRFPEIFRLAVRQGAQLFLVIANWPDKREQHWITLLRARAIENQAYVVGVNRCGSDPKFVYSGRSLIVDPQGEILADAGQKEGLVQAELELAKVTAWREQFPGLKDIRADYSTLQ